MIPWMKRGLNQLTFAMFLTTVAGAEELRVELLDVQRFVDEVPHHSTKKIPLGGVSGLACLIDERGEGTWIGVSDDKRTKPYMIMFYFFVGKDSALQIGTEYHMDFDREVAGRDLNAVDSEGIAVSWDQEDMFVVYEEPPAVARFKSRTGRLQMLDVPGRISSNVRTNRAFESIAYVERDERNELWVATEVALEGDGGLASEDRGTRCRVLVYDAERLDLIREMTYETQPLRAGWIKPGGYVSLTDAEGLPGGRVLFLERGFSLPMGAYAEIHVCDRTLREGERDEGRPPVLNKKLVCDIGALGVGSIGNLEAMALGPVIDDDQGGRLMILLSDDNFGSTGEIGTQVIALRVFGAE